MGESAQFSPEDIDAVRNALAALLNAKESFADTVEYLKTVRRLLKEVPGSESHRKSVGVALTDVEAAMRKLAEANGHLVSMRGGPTVTNRLTAIIAEEI